MSEPTPPPGPREARWDLGTRRALVLAGVGLVAGPLLPHLTIKPDGTASVDWWFGRDAESVDLQSGYPDRSPGALVYLVLGVWTLACARVRPLARRARLALVPALAVLLLGGMLTTWTAMHPTRGAWPGWVLAGWAQAALPALGLALVWTDVDARLGRRLCAFAGTVVVLYECVPVSWEQGPFAWVSQSWEQGLATRLWCVANLLVLAAGLVFLPYGLGRHPSLGLRWLAPRLWWASILALHVAGLLLVFEGVEHGAEDRLLKGLAYPVTIGREWGHYLLVVTAAFLWIVTPRRVR